MKDKLVFLGGTCGGNNWRDGVIAELKARGVPEGALFDPVVKDWNEAAQAAEEKAKANASHLLFYIADPKQEGINVSAYSLVEATMGLYDKPERTVVVFDTAGLSAHATKAINQSCKVLKTRFPQANIFATKDEAVGWLAKNLA